MYILNLKQHPFYSFKISIVCYDHIYMSVSLISILENILYGNVGGNLEFLWED